jgi:hypothetical protein
MIHLCLVERKIGNGRKGEESIGYRLGKTYRGQYFKFRTITQPVDER